MFANLWLRKIVWYFCAFMIFRQMNSSLFRAIFGITTISPNVPINIVVMLNLLSAFVAGSVFFTIIYPPGAENVLSNLDSVKYDRYFKRLLTYYFFSSFTDFFLMSTSLYHFGAETVFRNLAVQHAMFVFGIFTLLSTGFVYVDIRRHKQKRNSISAITAKSEPLKKFHGNLKQSEQEELAILVYRSKRLKQRTVQEIAIVFWGAIVIAFIYELIMQLLGRF